MPPLSFMLKAIFALLFATSAAHAATLDHIMIGARSLDEGIAEFQKATGVKPIVGGKHPGRGTQNALVSLGPRLYLEIIAPSGEKPDDPLAMTLQKLDKLTPLHWALRVNDVKAVHAKLKKDGFAITDVQPGSRVTPAGNTLRWTTFDFENFSEEGTPFFIEWSRDTTHPSTTSPVGCTLRSFDVASPSAKSLTRALRLAGYTKVVKNAKTSKMTLSLDCGGRVVRFGD